MRGFLIWVAVCLFSGSACAQIGPLGGRGNPINWWGPAAASYVGPGDVVAFTGWWVGIRAYSAAAAGTKAINICSESGGVDVTCEDELTSATTGKLVLGTVGATCSSVTCKVKIWYDQTGNNFCASAACNFTQATVANRATFLITGCPGTSGQPCASFNSSDSDCYVSTGSSTVVQPFSYTMVSERSPSSSSSESVFIDNTTTVQLGFKNAANTIQMFDSNSISGAASDAAPHSTQAAYDLGTASGSTLDIDGTSTTGTMAGSNETYPIILGTITSACTGQPLSGFFVEGGFHRSLFSSGNMSALTSNQRTFWGF